MDLISIIVPIYNVEKYLERCVNSIMNQTYKNLEIILVNDGSPDSCPELCDQLASEDNRIKVIHKTNGGLSDARNVGLDISSGKYIAFVDSDDWIHKEYIHYLYDAISASHADVSACGVIVTQDTIEDCELGNPRVDLYSTESALETLIHGEKFRAVVWNKLYKAELLENIRFEVGKYHEDEFFTYRVLAKAEKLSFIDSDLYFYYQRTGSIINSFSEKHLESLEAHLNRIEFLKINYPHLYKEDKRIFCRSCLYYYHICRTSNVVSKPTLLHRVKRYRSKITFSFSELKECSYKDFIYIVATKYCLGLFDFLLSMGRKAI